MIYNVHTQQHYWIWVYILHIKASVMHTLQPLCNLSMTNNMTDYREVVEVMTPSLIHTNEITKRLRQRCNTKSVTLRILSMHNTWLWLIGVQRGQSEVSDLSLSNANLSMIDCWLIFSGLRQYFLGNLMKIVFYYRYLVVETLIQVTSPKRTHRPLQLVPEWLQCSCDWGLNNPSLMLNNISNYTWSILLTTDRLARSGFFSCAYFNFYIHADTSLDLKVILQCGIWHRFSYFRLLRSIVLQQGTCHFLQLTTNRCPQNQTTKAYHWMENVEQGTSLVCLWAEFKHDKRIRRIVVPQAATNLTLK